MDASNLNYLYNTFDMIFVRVVQVVAVVIVLLIVARVFSRWRK